jgi:hypothetical protein
VDSTDGVEDELESSVAVVDGFETLRDLGENTYFVDLVDVGDDVCVCGFVFEEEGADIGWTTSEHFVDRSDGRIILDKDGF